MNEKLSEYYNDRAESIRQSSWSEAFLIMAIASVGLLVLFMVGQALYESGQARQAALVILGIAVAYVMVRYLLIWYHLRNLKLHVARKAMLE